MTTENRAGGDAPRLGVRQLVGYSAGDFGLNLFWQLGAYYLMFYFTDVVSLPGKTAGAIIAAGAIWSSLVHFTVGRLAERTKTQYGRYRPYVGFGSIPLGLSAIFLFSIPHLTDLASPLVLSVIALMLFKAFYPVVATPYSTLGARLTQDFTDRTRLSGTRMYFAHAGGACIIFVVATLQEYLPDEQVFSIASSVAAVLAVVLLGYCFQATETRVERAGSTPRAVGLRDAFLAIARNRALIIFVGAFMLKVIATTILNSTLLYVFIYGYEDRLAGNLTLIILSIWPFIVVPLASVLAIRLGKSKGWYLASVIAVSGVALLYFGQGGPAWWAIASYVVIGFGTGIYSVLIWSMIPDTIEYGELETGVRHESTIYGSFALFRGVSSMIAALIVGFLLDAAGYHPGSEMGADVVGNMFFVICFVSAACFLASMLILKFYPITAEVHASIIEKLSRKNNPPTEQAPLS